MGGLLSTTIYAVASVTTAAPPADPATIEATAGASPPAEYVIVDIPAFNRTAATSPPVALPSPGEPIARLDFDLAQAARQSPGQEAIRREPASIEVAAEPSGTGFQSAVVAAHDDRIALLRQQLARASQNDGAHPASLARDLQLRLRRAEAARDIAVARARSTDDCDARCPASPRPSDAHAGAGNRQAVDPPIRARASVADMAAQPPMGATAPRKAAGRAIAAVARRAAAERSTPEVAANVPVEVPAFHRGAPSLSAVDPDRLAFSRQRLATARRVLEDRSDLPPLMAGAAIVQPALPGDHAGRPLHTAAASPFDAFDPHLFWTFAAAKFGMTIASLLLLLVLGAVIRPRQLAARRMR